MNSFTHLHVHSDYSVLDGTNKLKPLCERIKELGMSAVAVTDHGVLHGVVDFYKTAKEVGIKPIIGVEAYVTMDQDGLEKKDMTRDNYHMILLAKNNTGLKNLYRLVSKANTDNFYYKPRISIHNLKDNHEGIIATSACLGGWIAKQGVYTDDNGWEPGEEQGPEKALMVGLGIFGKDFYVEIQDNGLPQQTAFNNWAIAEAKRAPNSVRLVMAADAHYLKAEDYATHQLIMAQQFKKTLDEYKGIGCEDKEALVYSDKLFIRSPEDMIQVCDSWGVPEAATNTLKIAEQCNVEIEIGKYKSPNFDVTEADDYEEFLQWQKTS